MLHGNNKNKLGNLSRLFTNVSQLSNCYIYQQDSTKWFLTKTPRILLLHKSLHNKT